MSAVGLEVGVGRLDEPHGAEVLHDGGIDAAVDAVAEVEQRVPQLGGLEQDVEREVDARPAGVGEAAGLLELVEGELRPVVAGVEALGAEVDGIRPVREGGAGGVEGAGGGEELRSGGHGFGRRFNHGQPASYEPNAARDQRQDAK